MHSERPQHRMYEQWHPLGVVGIISAFNFPVAVWSWNAFIAAVCGNVTVWKPSPKTPLCARRRAAPVQPRARSGTACRRSSSCSSTTARELATRFVDDRRVDLVSFTGSSAVGRDVGERVARRFGRCLLELGGNNAIIVDEHANLDLAVPAILFGAVGTAGQRCTSTRRLLVHQSAAGRTRHAGWSRPTSRCASAIRSTPGTLMGPLIDAGAVERFEQRADASCERQGGRAALRRQASASGPGNFVEPTIVRRARTSGAIVQHETFAPILYLIPCADLDEAIAQQNAVRPGPVVGDLHRPAAARRALPVPHAAATAASPT